MPYQPNKEILKKYADILVNFALGEDEGVQEDEVVNIVINEQAKPLLDELEKAVLAADGHFILTYLPADWSRRDYVNRIFYEHASTKQLRYFPEEYFAGLFEEIDHILFVIAREDKERLTGIDSEKIMERNEVMDQFHGKRLEKSAKEELSWSIALYPTEAMAAAVNLSLEEYWNEVIKACYLDADDPIAEWKKVEGQINKIKTKLNNMNIQQVHIEGDDADLTVRIGDARIWKSAGGNNIPSFEIFTSPDWRGTEGWIRFSEPLYRYGNMVEGIELEFEDGKVTGASAEKNEQVLLDMIDTENADRVGEFSLTDSRHSRITQFMAETLYDENTGGEYGNTHIALGRAYKDCIDVDAGDMSEEDWEELGVNDSAVHTDIISTTDRTVTATLADGSEEVIYENGQFQL